MSGTYWKTMPKREGRLSQIWKMTISSFTIENRTPITPLLMFYPQLRLVVTKLQSFAGYISKKCFKSFVQSAVYAGRKSGLKPNSSVVGEKMKLPATRFNGYQLIEEEFRCTEKFDFYSKTDCWYDGASKKVKFSSKSRSKCVLKQNGDGPSDRYRHVLDENVSLTPTNRGFRTNNHLVAIYEQMTKGLSYFDPKKNC